MIKNRSPLSRILVFLSLTVVGFGLIPQLTVRYLPSPQATSFSIDFTWPHVGPEAVEQQITAVLEGGLSMIEGIERIYSISKAGGGNIKIDLDKSMDVDFARFEVASKIRQLYPALPDNSSFPILSVYEPNQEKRERPILIYTLSGNDIPTNIYAFAQEILVPKLSDAQGLSRIEVRGGNQMEWRITYQPERLVALSLSAEDLLSAISQHFQNEALGTTTDGTSTLYVRLSGKADLTEVLVSEQAGRVFFLKDLATIELVESPPINYYRINGKNSIHLLYFAEADANTILLARKIKDRIRSIIGSLPDFYQLILEDDTTRFLNEELYKIRWRSLLSLSILLFFVLLVYRSIRFSILVLSSLLINLGIAIILYYALNIEINLYALAGITVSFGIIIDNTIVMAHHVQNRGDLHVFPALLASTLTTISALVIIFFLPDQWRHDMKSFAEVLVINLSVSLAVALWLVPTLIASQLRLDKPLPSGKSVQNRFFWHQKRIKSRRMQLMLLRAYERILHQLYRFRKGVVFIMILAFGIPIFMLPNKIEGWEWYNKSLGASWYIHNLKPTVNRILGGSLRLFVLYVYEGSSYRNPEETILYIQSSLPQGSTVHQLNELFEQIESYLGQYEKEIKQYTTRVDDGQFGSCKIVFNQGYDIVFPYQLKDRLIVQSLNWGGAQWNIYGIGKGFSNASNAQVPYYRVAMYGYHKKDLADLADQFAAILLRHPRVNEVNTEGNINWWEKDRYEYELSLDRSYLAGYQIEPKQVAQNLELFDRRIHHYFRLPDGLPVRLINAQISKNNLWSLEESYLPINDGQIVMKEISQLDKVKVSTTIHKENQQYVQIVEFEYNGTAQFGNKYLKDCMEAMRKISPLGYSLEKQDSSFFSLEDSQQLSWLLLLVITLIFFICSIQFESFRQAFAIIFLIPISFIGIFLSFYCFDFAFDQGGYTSFLLVSGLTVNSLILIINDYNYYRKLYPNLTSLNLYFKAFRQKIVPILLTLFSTALGLIPFLLNGDEEAFWFALALGTIGGLIFSIIILIFVVPLLLIRI